MSVKKAAKKVTKKTTSETTASSVQSVSTQTNNNLFKLNKKSFLIGLAVLIIALLFIFKNWFVVAIVNGQPISRLEMVQELEKQSGKQTLNSLVTKTLILQEAKKQNVNVSNQEIDAEINKIESNVKKQGKSLNDALQAQGLTRSDLMEQIKIQKIIEKLLGKDTKVTDEEVNTYIQQNSAQFPEGSDTPEFRNQIKEQLAQQKLSEKFQAWLAKLQKDAKISYFIQY